MWLRRGSDIRDLRWFWGPCLRPLCKRCMWKEHRCRQVQTGLGHCEINASYKEACYINPWPVACSLSSQTDNVESLHHLIKYISERVLFSHIRKTQLTIHSTTERIILGLHSIKLWLGLHTTVVAENIILKLLIKPTAFQCIYHPSLHWEVLRMLSTKPDNNRSVDNANFLYFQPLYCKTVREMLEGTRQKYDCG